VDEAAVRWNIIGLQPTPTAYFDCVGFLNLWFDRHSIVISTGSNDFTGIVAFNSLI
jgi:hypothetical protein